MSLSKGKGKGRYAPTPYIVHKYKLAAIYRHLFRTTLK